MRIDLLLNSPLLGNLILPLHLLLLKLSDVPHSNLLTELNKHLVLHLESKDISINIGEMQHRSATKWTSLCQSHQVHAVSQVGDLPLAGLDDPLDVVDARAKVCQFAL